MSKPKFTSTQLYKCPSCKFVIGSGNLITLKAVCPECNKLIEIRGQISSEMASKEFGRDRLKIAQMYDNRKDAVKAGHSHYFTSLPCKNAHIAPRTKKGECLECTKNQRERYLNKYPNKLKKHSQEFYDRQFVERKSKFVVTGYGKIGTNGSIHALTDKKETFCGRTSLFEDTTYKRFKNGVYDASKITCKFCLKSMERFNRIVGEGRGDDKRSLPGQIFSANEKQKL